MTQRMTIAEYRRAKKPKDERPWQFRYDSHAEEAFAKSGRVEFKLRYCPDKAVRMEFHSVTLRLAGQTYTPDFTFIVLGSDVRHYVEVKQTRHMPSYRDSRAKIRAAAATYPHDRFYVAWYEKGAFRFEEIN